MMKVQEDRRPEVKKRKDLIADEHEFPVISNKWKYRRWASIILINLMFVVSYWFDVQLVEGSMSASRFLGFHMADPNSALQVMLAFKEVMLNLVIGTVTVILVWWLVGGRAFCSWVCPYHLLSEWAEMIHSEAGRHRACQGQSVPSRPQGVLVGGLHGACLFHRLHGV